MTIREQIEKLERANFLAACTCPLLVGATALKRVSGPQPTHFINTRFDDVTENRRVAGAAIGPGGKGSLVLAVRKTQLAFPSMITVGRTANNDLVLPDVRVSKFHCWFKVSSDRVELVDAGSRNGTFVRTRRLAPKATPTEVRFGDKVRFGDLEFQLLEPGAAWDKLHAELDF
jgi:hypothetical protein